MVSKSQVNTVLPTIGGHLTSYDFKFKIKHLKLYLTEANQIYNK